MNLLPKGQHGLTMISMLVVLGVIGSIFLLILTIGPVYINHVKVKSALETIKNTVDAKDMSEVEVRTKLSSQFTVNDVNDVDSEDITITKRIGYLKVKIHYEVVKKLVGNLSALVEFDDSIEVGHE